MCTYRINPTFIMRVFALLWLYTSVHMHQIWCAHHCIVYVFGQLAENAHIHTDKDVSFCLHTGWQFIDDYTLAVPVYYCDIKSLLFPLCTPPFFVSRECAVCGLNINLTKDLFITSCLVLIYIPIFLTNERQIIKLDVGWSQAVQMTCVLPPYCFNIVSI